MNERINQLTHAYAAMFDDAVEKFVENHNDDLHGKAHYLAKNAFLITFVFKRSLNLAFDRSSDRSNAEFRNLDHIYNLICRRLHGRKYAKHRENQPLVIAALDVNGTRNSKHVSQVENVHIHSIWVTSSTLHWRIQGILLELRRLKNLEKFDIQRIDVRRLTNWHIREDGVSSVSSYVSKFLGQNAVRMHVTDDDFRIYPKQPSKKRDTVAEVVRPAEVRTRTGEKAGLQHGCDNLPPPVRQRHEPIRASVKNLPISGGSKGVVAARRKASLMEEARPEKEAMNAKFAALMFDDEDYKPSAPRERKPFVYEAPPAQKSDRVKKWQHEADRAATERRMYEHFIEEVKEELFPGETSLSRQPSMAAPQQPSAPAPYQPTLEAPELPSAPAPQRGWVS